MAARYFPRSDAELSFWLTNFQINIVTQAKALGVPMADIKSALDGAKSLTDEISVTEQRRADWQAAAARTAHEKKRLLPELQRAIDRLRVAPGHTLETGKALMAVPPRARAAQFDEFKPVLRATVQGGKVRLDWKRRGLDGINVYSRKQGDSVWQLLGRDNRPPYDDVRSVIAGQNGAEVREYRAIGVVRDSEVGQPSDILSVTLSA